MNCILIRFLILVAIALPIPHFRTPLSSSEEPFILANSAVFGPYRKFQDSENQITFTYTITKPLEKLYEELYFTHRKNNDTFAYSRKMIHELEVGEEHKVTFNLPTKYEFDADGYDLRFLIYSNENIVFDKTVILTPILRPTIDPTEYANSTYEEKYHSFQFVNSEIVYNNDVFTFDDFENYFTFNEYYQLRLDQYYIKYSNDNLTYKNAKLILYNPQDCFSSLIGSDPDEIDIPLTLKLDKNNHIYMEFSNSFYVDPKNLYMSLRKRDGFVSTNYFYFPINKKKEVMQQDFWIEINDFGPMEVTLRWQVKLLDIPNLIGDCSNSEYCLIGGVRK